MHAFARRAAQSLEKKKEDMISIDLFISGAHCTAFAGQLLLCPRNLQKVSYPSDASVSRHFFLLLLIAVFLCSLLPDQSRRGEGPCTVDMIYLPRCTASQVNFMTSPTKLRSPTSTHGITDVYMRYAYPPHNI